MEEKTIIKSKRSKAWFLLWVPFLLVGIILFIIGFSIWWADEPHSDEISAPYFVISLIFIVLGVLIGIAVSKMEITVTDKRVCGKTWFNKGVDLPLDSVSAVGSSWLQGIAVATSSGNISFLFIKNAQEIHGAIRKLLIARQEEKKQAVQPVQMVSGADDLAKYKQLLDQGVITQEEFNAKKKQILGL